MAEIITITSGKGGVGKTSISLNISLALAARGMKVCLFDADLGLANVSILTGIYPKQDLEAVIEGNSCLDDIMIKNYQGIDIIPGSSGVQKMADLTSEQTRTLIHSFLDMDSYDYFIFDTSAGISSQVLAFCMASHEIILVATTEPTSLTDAYSLLKVLSRHGYRTPVRVVINQVTSGPAAKKAYSKLKSTVSKFLSLRLAPLGVVAKDRNVRAAVVSQTPFSLLFPDSPASKCIRNICEKLIFKTAPSNNLPMELFWDRCLSFLETRKEKSTPQEPSPEEKAEKKTVVPDDETRKRLSAIEEKLSFLVHTIGEFKTLLEQHVKSSEKKSLINQNDAVAFLEPRAVELDFESWVKKNQR